MFEPTHGSAPKYAGQNKVNPIAQLLSGMLMLRHLGEHDAADRLERRDRRADPRRHKRYLRHEAVARRSDRGRNERGRRRDDREAGGAVSVSARRKITVVGAGNVGATCAEVLAARDYARRRPRRHQGRPAAGQGARHQPDGRRPRLRAERRRQPTRTRRPPARRSSSSPPGCRARRG